MFYKFVIFLARVFFLLFYRVEYKGVENIPKQDALIVCSNHISLLDMFLFAPLIPRKIHFMAKKELFDIPLLNIILKSLGAYPVNRGNGDRNAGEKTLQLLDEGKAVGIFPEGTRRKKNQSRIRPKAGTALFALKSGAQLLPIGIFGSYRIFSKLKVVYGEPYKIDYPAGQKATKAEMQKMVDDLMDKIYSFDQD